jgi:hypothetical protein
VTFECLTATDISAALARVPQIVREQLQRESVVLAGGCIRDTLAGLPVKDVDVFCHSREQAERLAFEAAPLVRQSLFAFSVDLGGFPVQYIFYKEFKDARDLVQQFDFRACCAGIYFRGTEERGSYYTDARWEGVAVEGFRADCRDRVLRFMSQEKDRDKLTALRRAFGFALKGWTISNEELTGIITHFEPTLDAERVRGSFRPAYGGHR